MVFANDDLDIDTERIRGAEHFDDASPGGPADRRKIRYLHVDGQALQGPVRVEFLGPVGLLRLCFFAEYAMWRLLRRGRILRSLWNQDRLRHSLVEGRNVIAIDPRRAVPRASPMRFRIVKDPDHCWVSSIQYTCNASGPSPISLGRGFIDENFVSLHRAVYFPRRDEQVVASIHASIRPHEPVPIAMQIDSSCHQSVAGSPILRR